MKQKTDGGPAFPVGSGDMRDPVGMSLRDYFAGQALAGLAVGWNEQPGSYEDCIGGIASAAYGIADAMLAERAKSGDGKEE